MPPMNTPTLPVFKSLRLQQDERNPRIARLVLNRPERLNAIGDGMPAEICAAVQSKASGPRCGGTAAAATSPRPTRRAR